MGKTTFKFCISIIASCTLFLLLGPKPLTYSNPSGEFDTETLIQALQRSIILTDTFKNQDFKTRYGLHSSYFKSKVSYPLYRYQFGLIFPEDAVGKEDPHISGAPQPPDLSNIKELEKRKFMAGTIPSVVWKDQVSKLFVKPDEQKAIVEHNQSHLILLTHLFGTTPLTSPQRELWKRESGEWVLDKDKKADHISGSPVHTLEGYSEIDFRQLSEDLFQWAETETSLNRFGKGVELFETYLKLDILNYYNRVPNIPDTVMEMKRRALQERLHELEKLAHDFPQTNEVKLSLLRAYHLLGERPESMPPGFIETVSTDKPQELNDLSDLAFRLGLTQNSHQLYLKAMNLNLFWRRNMDFELERAARGKLPEPDPPLTFDQSMQMVVGLIRGEQWVKAGEILAESLFKTTEFQRVIRILKEGPPNKTQEFRLDEALPQEFNPYYRQFTYHNLNKILAHFQTSLDHPDDPAFREQWKIPFDFDFRISPYNVIGLYVYRAILDVRVNHRPLSNLPTSSLILIELEPSGQEIRRGIFDIKNEQDRSALIQFLTGYTPGNYSAIMTGFIEPQSHPKVEEALRQFGAKRYGTIKNFVSYLYLNSVPPVKEGIEIITLNPVNLHFSASTFSNPDQWKSDFDSTSGLVASVKINAFKPDTIAQIVRFSPTQGF